MSAFDKLRAAWDELSTESDKMCELVAEQQARIDVLDSSIDTMNKKNFELYKDKRRAFGKLGWAMEFRVDYEKILDGDLEPLSECCGATGDIDTGICLTCLEHCEFVTGDDS